MLDGKYEITSERELGARATLFGATAPDGTALRITWYDLSPEEERDFESYRLLLRQLRREGYAAIYDLVARPGAYYVAWNVPEVRLPPDPEQLAAIDSILRRHGRSLESAYICGGPGAPGRIFELPFSSEAREAPTVPLAPKATPAPVVDNLWTKLWLTFRPWAIGSILALLGLLLTLIGFKRNLYNDLIYVPDVRGESVNAALADLYQAGFSTEAVPLTSSQPPGTVIDLNPTVGTLLRPGRTLSVSYALSAGRAAQAVPRLAGKDAAQGEAALKQAGFDLGSVSRVASPLPRGTIIAQTPAANAAVAQGEKVHLLLSTGPTQAVTFLPDLTGLLFEDALAVAEAAGFPRSSVSQDLTPGTDAAAGTVLDQNIKPFLSVPQNAQLRLSVAAGSVLESEANQTPDLIGLSLSEAQLQARGLGLSVIQSEEIEMPQLPPGIVLQRPAPGAALQNRIEVTVNRIPEAPSSVSANQESQVRRAEYSWLLGPERLGARATVTVTMTLEDGNVRSDVLIREQRVTTRTLSGVYLTTVSGPLTFRLTLNGQPYGPPLTRDP